MKIYTIYDEKSEEYTDCIILKNDEVAKRWFKLLLEKVPEVVKADLHCFCLGSLASAIGLNPDYHEVLAEEING